MQSSALDRLSASNAEKEGLVRRAADAEAQVGAGVWVGTILRACYHLPPRCLSCLLLPATACLLPPAPQVSELKSNNEALLRDMKRIMGDTTPEMVGMTGGSHGRYHTGDGGDDRWV